MPGRDGVQAGTGMKIGALAVLLLLSGVPPHVLAQATQTKDSSPAAAIGDMADRDRKVHRAAARRLEANWHPGFAPMLVEIFMLLPPGDVRGQNVLRLLRKGTGQNLPADTDRWWRWIWSQDEQEHPEYATFKTTLYSFIDKRFARYFVPGTPRTIRLDEVVWGGVKKDGIPPLEYPKMVSAAEADYLKNDHIVFGVYLNGEAKAYPKRILAWHELFNDRVGGIDVTCAYCTLCGSAVLYDQKVGERQFSFGTSGFLYRSNKLMYDRQTNTLWSALEGVPVMGSLVGSGLQLKRLPIVTTRWKEWRRRHPETKVLSLDTGHERDYGEGAAYREYFATDRLMFPTPFQDERLKNKQEVLAMLMDGEAVAYDTRYLRKRRLHQDRVGGQEVVILTDKSGASRVYDATGVTFTKWNRNSKVRDSSGQQWEATETALVGPNDEKLIRLAAHRAFWFGWRAQFPNTRLVK